MSVWRCRASAARVDAPPSWCSSPSASVRSGHASSTTVAAALRGHACFAVEARTTKEGTVASPTDSDQRTLVAPYDWTAIKARDSLAEVVGRTGIALAVVTGTVKVRCAMPDHRGSHYLDGSPLGRGPLLLPRLQSSRRPDPVDR